MILNPDWQKPKEKPYFHQISIDCIEKLVECIERFNKGKIDADTSLKISKHILENEFEDEEFLNFAIENYSEMFGYINTGRVNIRIHRDITGNFILILLFRRSSGHCQSKGGRRNQGSNDYHDY